MGQEWEVDDQPDPQTEYGRTKRMGKNWLRSMCLTSISSVQLGYLGTTVRTVFTMQNLAKTHKTLTVVNDQHGRPTWTRTC